ncbi:hypothetical protein SM124_13210 [Bacillus sp. 31A1R]|uniref:LAGLIDADG endonuclease n=1 Tax=Robertmurraya mangrovi TaxID=3098077 RepID=A0ABU5IZX7_9BACI|nr:hypothetical protein [Bacillus sp. 31A1R]MDZ5472691.1 hypothetical protein [Bacillus sp. 31A1R]
MPIHDIRATTKEQIHHNLGYNRHNEAMGGMTMSNNRASSSNVHKDFLINGLGLKQVSNTTIFKKRDVFVLSPSVQNDAFWFDLRKVNVDKFDGNREKGYLLIRFFNQFLLMDLQEFLNQMVEEDKFAQTTNSGIHWKFKIIKKIDSYKVKSMINKREIQIPEVNTETLINLLGRELLPLS